MSSGFVAASNTEYFEKSKMEPIGHVVVDLEGKGMKLLEIPSFGSVE